MIVSLDDLRLCRSHCPASTTSLSLNFILLFFQDDDWQEEHKRLAELDEKDGLGLEGTGIGAESGLGDIEDSANLPPPAKGHPLPSSLPLPNFSTFSPHLPPPGEVILRTCK